MTTQSRISGFGWAVPPTILSNHDIAADIDTSDDWIVSRTGISCRHILEPGATGGDLAVTASLAALEHTGRDVGDITHILYATCTPDSICPSAACALAGKLGLGGRMAVDVNAACVGFLNGLALADAITARHPSACVLVVAAESLSHRCNWQDRSTAVLFGDGAGAVIVSGPKAPAQDTLEGRFADAILGSDGSKGELLLITGGGAASPYKLGDSVGPEYFIRMNGGLVFKHAVRQMTSCCQNLLERNSLRSDDVDLFVPHQANLRIIEAVGNRLGITGERVFVNLQKYGNTSAASIAIALGEARDQGLLHKGMTVLTTSFGGGLTYGAALIEF